MSQHASIASAETDICRERHSESMKFWHGAVASQPGSATIARHSNPDESEKSEAGRQYWV